MKQNNAAEILLSGAVIVVAAGFLLFTYIRTSGPALSDYDLSVQMKTAAGLSPGSDVQISGIKVGTVSATTFIGYRAQVRLKVHDDIKIPKDSVASAVSGGFLNPGAVLSIQPGKSSETLPPGGQMLPQL
jgi:phospholipid/cholesterol/gamma-HCH transport system substrate-binding protein